MFWLIWKLAQYAARIGFSLFVLFIHLLYVLVVDPRAIKEAFTKAYWKEVVVDVVVKGI